ncbi:hypothetical protein IPZ69_10600 [Streptomyces olivochromogenes]|nr:hypothetical protein [Streptomyces olivochromogenes]
MPITSLGRWLGEFQDGRQGQRRSRAIVPREGAGRPNDRTHPRNVTSADRPLAVLPAALAPVPTCEGVPATIVGTNGDDDIVGTSGNDVIVALAGNDRVSRPGRDSGERLTALRPTGCTYVVPLGRLRSRCRGIAVILSGRRGWLRTATVRR